MFHRQFVGVRIVGAQFECPAGSPATVMVVGKQHDHEQQRNGHDNAEYAFAVFHAAKIRIFLQEPVAAAIYLSWTGFRLFRTGFRLFRTGFRLFRTGFRLF